MIAATDPAVAKRLAAFRLKQTAAGGGHAGAAGGREGRLSAPRSPQRRPAGIDGQTNRGTPPERDMTTEGSRNSESPRTVVGFWVEPA